ncbi:hypothetical protein ACJIZ3_002289 [Penstemon smallii]|uniref:Uncharacterized protein n=1 Tax=Penstemon smallii TaxID=265156 RepID=A0ABD3U7J5_9LAMI
MKNEQTNFIFIEVWKKYFQYTKILLVLLYLLIKI